LILGIGDLFWLSQSGLKYPVCPYQEEKMENDDRVYRKLQKHLDKSPAGFAATESGADIKLLKHLLTPEEAGICLILSNIKKEPVTAIHKRVTKSGMSMTAGELQKKLDHMVQKGTILVFQEGYPERRYMNVGVSAGGMIDFQVNRLTKDFVDILDKYHEESFARKAGGSKPKVAQLRTIPVEKSILVSKNIVSSYDDVRKLVEQSPGPFSVTNCVCRQMKDLRDQRCKYSDLRETCLQIGSDHARQYVEMGISRFITREEVYTVLEKAQAAGFILQPENSQHPGNICCCCGDCCGPVSAAKKSPRPVDFFVTNYYCEVDPGLCTGCEVCIRRCQLEARVMAGGKSAIDRNRCIGCGNCIVTCKPGASRLIKKAEELVPPRDKDEFLKISTRKKSQV
jgi:Na+-translocating ferredoxin:NAD+ oxidoreductase subunit B